MKTRIACAVLVVMLGGALAPQVRGAAAAAHTRPATTFNITIKNLAFSPMTATITAGTTVVWTNMDPFTHTVTSDTTGGFNSGNLGPGKTFRHTFRTRGTFQYDCHIHPFMEAAVQVH